MRHVLLSSDALSSLLVPRNLPLFTVTSKNYPHFRDLQQFSNVSWQIESVYCLEFIDKKTWDVDVDVDCS